VAKNGNNYCAIILAGHTNYKCKLNNKENDEYYNSLQSRICDTNSRTNLIVTCMTNMADVSKIIYVNFAEPFSAITIL